MEKAQKVKLMKLSDYELGETLGTGNRNYKLIIMIYLNSHRFIWTC